MTQLVNLEDERSGFDLSIFIHAVFLPEICYACLLILCWWNAGGMLLVVGGGGGGC